MKESISKTTKSTKDEKNKRNIIVAVIILVLTFLLILFMILHNSQNKPDKKDGVAYESSAETINDDTPLAGQKSIVFPGFAKKVLTYSKTKSMNLQNPKSNSVSFVYSIQYEGKEIYKSESIKPGEIKKWNVCETIKEKGKYSLTVIITPYDETGTQKNGFKQNITVEVK